MTQKRTIAGAIRRLRRLAIPGDGNTVVFDYGVLHKAFDEIETIAKELSEKAKENDNDI